MIAIYKRYCLNLAQVSEEQPFDNTTLVYKVKGKMFALLGKQEDQDRISLKCDPEKAIELRATYPNISSGYHLNKKHWNTIVLDGSISNKLIKRWIKDSYDLVVSKMPKYMQIDLVD